MICGLGIDVVNVSRMKRWLTIPGLPERFFHPDELLSARQNDKTIALSLSARFAAKEAFGKAIGSGLSGIALKDIFVKNSHNGKPELKVIGTAKSVFEKTGANKIHLSLTHEKNAAVAVVILEKIQYN